MMQPTTPPERRPINAQALDSHVIRKKLKSARMLAEGEQVVTLAPNEFIPVIRAEVGSEVAVSVYRYRLLLPLVQVFRESPRALRRVEIAAREDLAVLRDMLIRHFGGVTMNAPMPSPLLGVGARDPDKPTETLEENEHATFEVYAAPIQESDDYFRTLRKELQEALGEGVILIERSELTLI